MAQTITKISQSTITSSLDTYNHTAGRTSMYIVKVRVTNPLDSAMSIVVQQNGVTKGTSVVPAARQGTEVLNVPLNCTSGDLISIILSSANNSDNQLNVMKAIIDINQGPVS